MGKRKERRVAALMTAGRRVKLDLFAEPSGDLGGSPAEEVEGGVDTKLKAGLPMSPSSSGQQPANPLLLLGQYSDNDMEDCSSDDNQDPTQAENDKQIKPTSKEPEEVNVASSEEPLAKTDEFDAKKDAASIESLQGLGNNVTVESNAAASNGVSHEKSLESPEHSVPSASDIHATVDDGNSCWKMVLHEESNSYYYWNTMTGETSWEVPPGFAPGVGLTCEPQTSLAEVAEDNVHRDMYTSSATGGNEVSYTSFPSASHIAQPIQECKGDGSLLISGSGSIGAVNQENVTLGSYSSYVPPTDPLFDVGSWCETSGASNIYMHGGVTNNQDEAAVADLQSHLVTRSESLLEKLRSLRGPEDNSNEQHAWTSKYISEIEIRLFDLKSLLSCGLSLAPFWSHSETQLKRLEDAINSEIGSYVESELKNEITLEHLHSSEGRDEKQENVEGKANLDEDIKNGVVSSVKSCTELDDIKLLRDDERSLLNGTSCDEMLITKQGPDLTDDRTQAREEDNTSNEISVLANVNFKPEPHPMEEDMDVDMEVEDTSLPSIPTATEIRTLPSEQLSQPSALADQQPLASGVESFAPPDDDWIPPPPPDNEEIPPPPPDDPPESSSVPPPPYPEPEQTLTYPTSYSLTYPDPNYGYYGHVGVTLPNQPVYYETVPCVHAEASETLNNLVGPTMYYIQNAEAPSSFQVVLAPTGYDAITSNLAETNSAQAQMTSFHNSNIDAYALHGGAELITSTAINTSVSAASCCAPSQESVLASHDTTRASSAAVSALTTVSDSSSAAAKPQSKALRVKKRAVSVASSLRSNKKVSSLVDKWKAAKEELEEADEEEPENALMILEKKRQREIEEWRAHQIASGEAKENANFQPLGGDWRERVKRKRAKRAASVETPVEETIAEKKQPDLTKYSKGLPPGWQAYWDGSSKKVYYGNTITSKTSWTRPPEKT